METLPLTKIKPDANQPRKYFGADKMAQLKNSIKTHGIVNPLIVQKDGEFYLLVDGERRYRAAKDLNLKEVPVAVIRAKDPIQRAIEQFHIQEQHEAWSPTEKAQVLMDLAASMKKPLVEVAELLGINKRTAETYMSFSRLSDKERFASKNIPIIHAEGINSLKRFVKDIKERQLDEPFSLTDERKLEKVIVDMIGDGEITNKTEYAKLKSSFRNQPKFIDKFMDGKESVSELYVKSKAQSTQILRNLITSAQFTSNYAHRFMEKPETKVTASEVATVKNTIKALKEFVALVGDIED
jgi:ParB family chromosome partitioning protein